MNSPTDKTFRGRTLAEILDQVRADLGEDAIITGRREELVGGVGGFFAKREIEIDARAAGARLDLRDDSPAEPEGFEAELLAAASEFVQALPPAPQAEPEQDEISFGDMLRAQVARGVEPDAVIEQLRAPEPAAAQLSPELIAGFEPQPPAAPAPAPEASPFLEQVARVYDINADATQALIAKGLTTALAHDIQVEAEQLLPIVANADLNHALRDALARRIPVARLGGGEVVGFVGPGGAGKTRCVAILATAYATRSQRQVACVTLRPKDGGEELRRMLSPHGIAVHAAADAAQASACIAQLRTHQLVVLDTPSLHARDLQQLAHLADELAALRPDELHLCVPATMALAPGRMVVEAGRRLGVNAMAITHADETDELGGSVELAIETGMPISLVGRLDQTAPVVAQDLAAALVS